MHLGCHSCKSKATNRRVWSREQLYLSESKMISLIRISYSFRFIVRRSVSTDSYDRLDFTNFRIRYCTFLLLNKIMAILGCLIAISLDSWWLKGPGDKLNLLKGVFCFIKSSDSKDVNIGRTRKKTKTSFFLCTMYRNGSWLHHSKILWSMISDKFKKKTKKWPKMMLLPWLVKSFRACSKAVIPEPLSFTPGDVFTVS